MIDRTVITVVATSATDRDQQQVKCLAEANPPVMARPEHANLFAD
jgi:hypothetical protein